MADQSVEKGDKVSWQWGGSHPSGEVANVVKDGEASVTSHRGNEIKKSAEEGDPAIEISRSGNDVVKNASELNVDAKGSGGGEEETASGAADGGEGKEDDHEMKDVDAGAEKNGDAKAGEKRDFEEVRHEEKSEAKDANGHEATEEEKNADLDEKEDKPKAKKQKTDDNDAESKKGRGRPKKGETNGEKKAAAAPAKKKEPKKAATETGEPRRSSRSTAKADYAE